MSDYIKMDYTLKTPQERIDKVKEIIAATPPERLTQKYIEAMVTYIFKADPTIGRSILTDNIMVTVNRRELSFEGLVSKFENGEDGIYNMIAEDKNIIAYPKNPISAADIEEIPDLKALVETIEKVKQEYEEATGLKKKALFQQLRAMYQDQYVIRAAYKKPIYSTNLIKSIAKMDLSEKITINKSGQVESTGLINLYNEKHISMLLCNYSHLKQESWSNFNSDMKWLLEDLENIIESLYPPNTFLRDLIVYKIDGRTNAEIQDLLLQGYGTTHSVEYLSSLWRNKIPKTIAEEARKQWIIWHFTEEVKGEWKKCSRCGEIKPAHNYFFSKNNTSKDGWYSICKCCRNKKEK